jgi:hypothetical protein
MIFLRAESRSACHQDDSKLFSCRPYELDANYEDLPWWSFWIPNIAMGRIREQGTPRIRRGGKPKWKEKQYE